ncbi:hypothetical protein BDV97DRAFT_61157 [Delphinella strobiligena]|nr:hypothetical protein BDV97DRAFT_61157 [Delphinella strobiligena]
MARAGAAIAAAYPTVYRKVLCAHSDRDDKVHRMRDIGRPLSPSPIRLYSPTTTGQDWR